MKKDTKEEIINAIDRMLTEMLTEYANTPLNQRGNGWDWILKARTRLHELNLNLHT